MTLLYQRDTPTRSPPPVAISRMERLVEMMLATDRPMGTTPMKEGGNRAMIAWKAPYKNVKASELSVHLSPVKIEPFILRRIHCARDRK